MQDQLDDLDRQIIGYFHGNPRSTNRALAKHLGIAEATVASRIRRLVSTKALRFTVQRDLRAMGYAYQAAVGIFVEGRPVVDVAHDVSKIRSAQTVVTLLGPPQVFAMINAANRSELLDIVNTEFKAIPGVERVQLDIVMDVQKYDTRFGLVRTD